MLYDVLLGGQLVWNLPWLVVIVGAAAAYGFFIRYSTNLKINQRQPLLFFLSLIIFYLMVGSPLSAFSHLTFSSHMVQMGILFFIFPPFFLLGIPAPLWTAGARILLKPKPALYAFAVLFLLYHIPVVLTFLLKNSFYQNGYLIVLMFLAMGMWRPITGYDFSPNEKKRFAFLSGLVLLPACLLLVFSAIAGEMNSPYLSQLTVTLCITPSDYHQLQLLPPYYNLQWDQMMAGFFMLGLHKFGIMLTLRLEEKVRDRKLATGSNARECAKR